MVVQEFKLWQVNVLVVSYQWIFALQFQLPTFNCGEEADYLQ